MEVVGLDLSLTATGVATEAGTEVLSTSLRGCERLAWIRDRICSKPGPCRRPGSIVFPDPPDEWWEGGDPLPQADLVVIEGPSYGSQGRAIVDIGMLHGVILVALHEAGIPVAIVSPSSLKKYATGKGNAPKAEVLAAAIRRLGYEGHDDNEADALWLRTMALDHYGHPSPVPQAHRDALAKVAWPELAGAGPFDDFTPADEIEMNR